MIKEEFDRLQSLRHEWIKAHLNYFLPFVSPRALKALKIDPSKCHNIPVTVV